MSERHDTFAGLKSFPDFETKPKRDKPVSTEAIDLIADESGFHSRPAIRSERKPKRKARVYRTGRNINVNIKLTEAARERFYRLADERNLVLGALLEQALEALENTKAGK
jgi:hypothetical protein